MADLIKKPIIKMDPSGDEDLTAEWIPATAPSTTGVGRVTVRKRYPTGGTGIGVDSNGVVTALIDDDTIQTNSDGKLVAKSAGARPAVMVGKSVSGWTIPTGSAAETGNMLQVDRESGNEYFACSDGYVTADARVTWVTAKLLVTVECADADSSLYMVPVVIVANDVPKSYMVDTTESPTVISHSVTLFNADGVDYPVKLYMYKDVSDTDADKVELSATYRVEYFGV